MKKFADMTKEERESIVQTAFKMLKPILPDDIIGILVLRHDVSGEFTVAANTHPNTIPALLDDIASSMERWS